MDEKLLELGYRLVTEPLVSREGIRYSTVGRLISPSGEILCEREDFDHRIDGGAAIATARRHAVETGLVDVSQCRLTSRYGAPCPGCGYHTSVVAEDSDGMTWRACPWLRASAALGARLAVIRRQYGLVWPEGEAGPPADGHPTIASLFARRQKDEP